MNPIEGLLFLLAGMLVFSVAVVALAAFERNSRTPRRTVAGFQQSRRAMRRIFRAHVARREAARVRARDSHPTRPARRHRRSA